MHFSPFVFLYHVVVLCSGGGSSHGGGYLGRLGISLFVNLELLDGLGGSVGLGSIVKGVFRGLCALRGVIDRRGGGVCGGGS